MNYSHIRPTSDIPTVNVRFDPLTTQNVTKYEYCLIDDTTVSTEPSINPFADPRDNLCHESSINLFTDYNPGQDPSINSNIYTCQYMYRIPNFDPSDLIERIFLIPLDKKA